MKKQVSLLSRHIRIKNREGIEQECPLSVLRFFCGSVVADKIVENPNRRIEFDASGIEVTEYGEETPFTLQSDALIYIDKIKNRITVK